MQITFLIPGNSCSGGVRVTVQMGNCLLDRGHRVRVAYPKLPFLSRQALADAGRALLYRFQRTPETRWLSWFRGPMERYRKLSDLELSPGEVVIATGIHTIPDLQALEGDYVKVRYCHGLLEQEPEESRKSWLWSGKMFTIAVSPVLVDPLKALGSERILGVVPNGIFQSDYFVEERNRDGIGFIFSGSSVKGPEIAVSVVIALRNKFPGCLSMSSERIPDPASSHPRSIPGTPLSHRREKSTTAARSGWLPAGTRAFAFPCSKRWLAVPQ